MTRSRQLLRRLSPWPLLLLCLAACTEPNPVFLDPSDNNPCAVGQVVIEAFNPAEPTKVDIIMVIDNSPNMGNAQEGLSVAMPAFVQQMNEAGLDYQLAIISTDVVHGDQQGRFQTGVDGQPGCPGDRPLVVTPQTQASDLVAACNVVLGESGDEFEAGLEAVRYALLGPAAEPGGENEGFLREDARFVVIIFSDEDDCSDRGDLDRQDPNECEWDRDALYPLETYIGADNSFFTLIRNASDGRPIDLAVIVGPDDGVVYLPGEVPQPVCAANGNAFHGRRYIDVASALGDRGGFYNICSQGYGDILDDILTDHVMPHEEPLCPFLNTTQEPISVRLVDAVSSESTPLVEGAAGWLYLGPTAGCPNGVVQIDAGAHGRGSADERIEVHYCTDEEPP